MTGMNKGRTVSSGCAGKVGHPTFTEASKAARVMSRFHHDARFAPYRCKFCSEFHVGESGEKNSRDRAAIGRKRRRASEVMP